ncbi:DNA-binding protein [Pseudomonas aeruginosa]|uniref:KilA-N domain-containing protein n=1 Tax=Pseudomonas aeruginosa TaxID=287 RepID=UPI00093DEE53|nr:KilA-N domain-containing protein [Pseudomonas aeruginosa]MDI4064559.1 KilA-N domain-containing protein [Pseudomonas aeruginosa]RUI15062.1 DNA-binding protein [Pseudomonas aeruginosa]GLE86404.1 DNA-binding protein [Pseudomonas aeruginosa]HCL4015107.1 KilA-N domain-containing protein [Pseudomonas aeruginosa]
MNNLISLKYQGEPVRFTPDGWLHATKIAERFGKRIDHWLDNAETLEYIRALDEVLSGAESQILDTRNSGYVKTSRARVDRGGGTWLHPLLAVAFARWLDAKFSVWCDLRIEELLHGNQSAMDRFNRACKAYEEGEAAASDHGRGLSLWKQEKPRLLGAVERVRSLLQMTLSLE